jgi:hypothetical protein
VPKSVLDQTRSNRAKVDGTLNLLVAARDAKVKSVILEAPRKSKALPRIGKSAAKKKVRHRHNVAAQQCLEQPAWDAGCGSVRRPVVLILLSGATKFLDESFHIQSFNPASDGCRRQLRARPSVDYDRPSGPFEEGSTQ